VELQDLSAQRAVASVDWPAEGRILDYCAGGGGKALAIADRTDAEISPMTPIRGAWPTCRSARRARA
jgi:16S rRNA C967 or C1407 C5-methylase (RsmB/RsmF family)